MRWKWTIGVGTALLVLCVVVTVVVVSGYDYNALKPHIAQAAKSATGRELTLGGDIKLAIGLTPALVIENVRFQNAAWGTQPDMITVKRLEVQVALLPLLSGDVDVRRLLLIEPTILVETNDRGVSNLVFNAADTATKPLGQVPALIVNDLQIKDGRLTYHDGRTGERHEITLTRLNAAASGFDSPLSLNLQGTYRKQLFKTAGTLGPLTTLLKQDNAWPVNLSVALSGTTVTVNGTLQKPLVPRGIELNVAATGKDIGSLAELTGHPLPVQGPFDVSGRVVDGAPQIYGILDMKTRLGENLLNGNVKVDLTASRPQLTAILSSSKLDLRPLLPPSTASPGKREKVFPAAPLPLDLLTPFDATVKVQVGQLWLSRLVLHNLAFNVQLKDQRLTLKPLTAVIGGGTLDGHLDLKPSQQGAKLAAVAQIIRLDLGRMRQEMRAPHQVEGHLDVDVEIKGRGRSIAEIMAQLNGSTNVVMGKASFDNAYIKDVGGDLSAGIFRLLNPFNSDGNTTTVNCFVSRFSIKDGIADSTALVLDTSTMSVIGKGTINLQTEKLNLPLKPSPKRGVGSESTGKATWSFTELAKPFKLGGTLANPSLAIDPTQTALIVGKTVGGVVLLGPVGIAVALIGTSSGDENPCLHALTAADQSASTTSSTGQKKQNVVSKTAQNVSSGVKNLFRRFGQAAKSQPANPANDENEPANDVSEP